MSQFYLTLTLSSPSRRGSQRTSRGNLYCVWEGRATFTPNSLIWQTEREESGLCFLPISGSSWNANRVYIHIRQYKYESKISSMTYHASRFKNKSSYFVVLKPANCNCISKMTACLLTLNVTFYLSNRGFFHHGLIFILHSCTLWTISVHWYGSISNITELSTRMYGSRCSVQAVR